MSRVYTNTVEDRECYPYPSTNVRTCGNPPHQWREILVRRAEGIVSAYEQTDASGQWIVMTTVRRRRQQERTIRRAPGKTLSERAIVIACTRWLRSLP